MNVHDMYITLHLIMGFWHSQDLTRENHCAVSKTNREPVSSEVICKIRGILGSAQVTATAGLSKYVPCGSLHCEVLKSGYLHWALSGYNMIRIRAKQSTLCLFVGEAGP